MIYCFYKGGEIFMLNLKTDKYKMLYELEKDNKDKIQLTKSLKGKKASIVSNTMFKAMFQNSNRIKYSCKLLSYFLDISYEELLKSIKLIKNDVDMEYREDKNERCDYVAEVDGSLINIEVNNNTEISTMERNIEYAYRLYGNKVKKGEEYNYTQTIQININNFGFKGNEEIIDKYTLQNEQGIRLTNKIIIINIYVPKLREKRYNKGIEGLKEEERYLLALIEEDEELAKELGKGDPIMEEYVKEAREVSGSRSFGESYDKEIANQRQARMDGYEEGIIDGEKKGKQEGISIEKKNIALSMIKDKVDVDMVAKYTGLSKEEIINLK